MFKSFGLKSSGRITLSFLIALGSILPVVLFAERGITGEPSEELFAKRTRVPIIRFNSCETSQVLIELNTQSRTSKADLILAFKTLADYPQLEFVPTHATGSRVAFTMSIRSQCSNRSCVSDSGFHDVQNRLARIQGTRFTCALPQGDEPEHKQEEQDEGGVTSGN